MQKITEDLYNVSATDITDFRKGEYLIFPSKDIMGLPLLSLVSKKDMNYLQSLKPQVIETDMIYDDVDSPIDEDDIFMTQMYASNVSDFISYRIFRDEIELINYLLIPSESNRKITILDSSLDIMSDTISPEWLYIGEYTTSHGNKMKFMDSLPDLSDKNLNYVYCRLLHSNYFIKIPVNKLNRILSLDSITISTKCEDTFGYASYKYITDATYLYRDIDKISGLALYPVFGKITKETSICSVSYNIIYESHAREIEFEVLPDEIDDPINLINITNKIIKYGGGLY